MSRIFSHARAARTVCAASLAVVCCFSNAATPDAARRLHEREAERAEQLANNDFRQPLVIESRDEAGTIAGDVYARLPQPFELVARSLRQPAQWCDVMILHLNVKRCRPGADGLVVLVGRKFDQPPEQAQRIAFGGFGADAAAQYLDVRMNAPEGPLGTHDYRIEFEAVPDDAGGSFVHFRYAFGVGTMGRLAMNSYLLTLGAGKVGFSPAQPGADAAAPRIGGARGAVERNAMRYYLAVAVCLASADAAPAERNDLRIAGWFDATERYPRQLHELDRAAYLAMKRHEIAHQTELGSAF